MIDRTEKKICDTHATCNNTNMRSSDNGVLSRSHARRHTTNIRELWETLDNNTSTQNDNTI